ncbi:MAG: DUF2510 domain-containing protein [Acidimicrobiales bacterium]
MRERALGPSRLAAIIVIAIGAALALPGGVVIAVRTIGEVSAKAMATPGVSERQLGSGRWFIYQRTGTTTGGGGFTITHNNPPTLQPSDVVVGSADGSRLAVSYVTVNETLTQNGRIYTAVVQFDVPSAGLYRVQVATPNSSVIVNRSLGYTFGGLVGFIAVTLVGGLVLLAGIILLIVGVVRRSGAEAVRGGQRAWNPTPAGFYPDQQSGRMRWWDGSRWTDHQR